MALPGSGYHCTGTGTGTVIRTAPLPRNRKKWNAFTPTGTAIPPHHLAISPLCPRPLQQINSAGTDEREEKDRPPPPHSYHCQTVPVPERLLSSFRKKVDCQTLETANVSLRACFHEHAISRQSATEQSLRRRENLAFNKKHPTFPAGQDIATHRVAGRKTNSIAVRKDFFFSPNLCPRQRHCLVGQPRASILFKSSALSLIMLSFEHNWHYWKGSIMNFSRLWPDKSQLFRVPHS